MIRAPWLTLLAIAASSCSGPEPRPVPRHVLLVLVDTLRADHLGAYGYARDTSPNLDRLASEGVLFRHALSQSSWTSPSMISLFSGHHVAEDRLHLPPELPTLAELFQAGGYATGAFTASQLLTAEHGFERGFDRTVRLEQYGSNEAIAAWIAEHAGGRALTYVHLTTVHDPHVPPDPPRFREATGAVDTELAAHYADLTARLGLRDGQEALRRIEAEIGGYDDDVRHADRRIQELLEVYADLGLANSTAVVIASDHGEGLFTREAFLTGRRGRALAVGEPPTLYNTLMPTHGSQVSHELLHVPLILSAPGLPAGRVVDGLVQNVDILPTLLELCGLPSPPGLHGRSLVGLMRAEGGSELELAFSHTRFNSSVIASDGFQLVLPTELGRAEEGLETALYDLRADPRARRNLAAEHPERVAELANAVEAHLRRGISGDAPLPSAEARAALHELGYTDTGLDDP